MARMSRVVIPGAPHHVTQRGARRRKTFFGEADYIAYLRYTRQINRRERWTGYLWQGRFASVPLSRKASESPPQSLRDSSPNGEQ